MRYIDNCPQRTPTKQTCKSVFIVSLISIFSITDVFAVSKYSVCMNVLSACYFPKLTFFSEFDFCLGGLGNLKLALAGWDGCGNM